MTSDVSGLAAATVLDFNTGDVVRLRSGGPWMTVEWCAEQWASCVWVDGQGVCQKRQFDARLLERGQAAAT